MSTNTLPQNNRWIDGFVLRNIWNSFKNKWALLNSALTSASGHLAFRGVAVHRLDGARRHDGKSVRYHRWKERLTVGIEAGQSRRSQADQDQECQQLMLRHGIVIKMSLNRAATVCSEFNNSWCKTISTTTSSRLFIPNFGMGVKAILTLWTCRWCLLDWKFLINKNNID